MVRSARTAVRAKPLNFRYVAHAGQNRVVKGTVKAVSEVAAQNLLVEQGYTPVSLNPVPSVWSLEGAIPSMFGVKGEHVITFSRQLATLLESGVSLLPALQLLESQASINQAFARIVRTMAQDLGMGKSFAQAISRHPAAFNDIYARTIAVGERTGNLETVLRQMADYIEKQGVIAKKISKAMAYPTILFFVAIVVSFILMTVALPPLTNMFTMMNVDLPLTTRILMAVSGFMSAYVVYMLAGAVALTVGLVWYLRQPRGRQALDKFKLNVPVLGKPLMLGELARMCRTMQVLLGAGLILQEVMELLPQTTSNSIVQRTLQQVKQGLVLGQGLTSPMSADPFFPPLMLQMVRVGEESNTLGRSMSVLADFYESSADEKISTVTSMITPVSTLLMAGIAGFIALSVIMPMYSITGSF